MQVLYGIDDDDVMPGKCFLHYRSFMMEIHQSPADSHTKGQLW